MTVILIRSPSYDLARFLDLYTSNFNFSQILRCLPTSEYDKRLGCSLIE